MRLGSVARKSISSSFRAGLLAASLWCVDSEQVSARGVKMYSEQELVDGSNLIVIATPLANRLTDERDKNWPVLFVDTSFVVSKVIKGDTATKSVVLHHFEETAAALPNGADPVSFHPGARKKFRLYLRRLDDGRYAPVSGYPDIGQSIREEPKK